MDLVLREYEVGDRSEAAALVVQLHRAGYNILSVTQVIRCKFFCIWNDGIVTGGLSPLDLPEVKADDFKSLRWDSQTVIEPKN